MLTTWKSSCVVLSLVAWSSVGGSAHPGALAGPEAQPWLQSFPVDDKDLATVGENPYFVLKPGYKQVFDNGTSGKPSTLVITVLNETKTVAGVETRIVEERETKGGEIIEVSRNYFAISSKTGDVYYFGEDVDMYQHGKVVSHDGAWLHGSNGAKLGLAMPGKAAVGARYYQEQAQGVAMDRVEIVSLTERLTTRAGTFERCLKVKETTPLEPLVREYKVYAPGVGLVKDGDLLLVSHGYAPQ